MTEFVYGHGPDAIRREFEVDGWPVRPFEVRNMMGGCHGCQMWLARRAKVSRMHAMYGRRRGHA